MRLPSSPGNADLRYVLGALYDNRIQGRSKVAGLFQKAMTDVRDLFATAQQDAANLETTDLTQFRAASSPIGNAITQGGTKLSQTFKSAGRKYKAANKILGAERACRALSWS